MHKEDWLALGGGLGAIALVLYFAIWWAALSCEAKSVSFEDHNYMVISGCMVKHKGKWLPLENIRGFD